MACVLPTPNNLECARLVGDQYDSRLHAHTGRSVAVDDGVGAFYEVPAPDGMAGPGFDYAPTGNEKGHAPYDISVLLTRHSMGYARSQNGTHGVACVRVIELRRSALKGIPAKVRLNKALALPCTCGAGNSMSEQSSLTNKKENNDNESPTS